MSYFGIMSHCGVIFGPIINVGHNDLYFFVPYLEECFMDECHTLGYRGSYTSGHFIGNL